MNTYQGMISLINFSLSKYKRGLIFAFEGVESVGKTSTALLIHSELLKQGINSYLLADYYEKTDHSGPLIAAITENPCIKLENDLSLFLLYCARLSDKLFASYELSKKFDIIIMDRIDLTLNIRAKYGWDLKSQFVDDVLDGICSSFFEDDFNIFIQCLTARNKVLKCRSQYKNKFRRRSRLPISKRVIIHNEVIKLAKSRSIQIVDTSLLSYGEILETIDVNAMSFYRKAMDNERKNAI